MLRRHRLCRLTAGDVIESVQRAKPGWTGSLAKISQFVPQWVRQLEYNTQVPAKFRLEYSTEELSSSAQRSTVRMKDAGDWSVQQSNQAIQAIHANEFRRFHRPLVKPVMQKAVAASYKAPSNSAQLVSFKCEQILSRTHIFKTKRTMPTTVTQPSASRLSSFPTYTNRFGYV